MNYDIRDSIRSVLIRPLPDCQLWPQPNHKGYGTIDFNGRRVRVHRLMWEAEHGPIPEDLVIDHLCRIRSCCNTEHMRLVTPSENSKRRVPGVQWTPPPGRRRLLVVGGQCTNGHDLEEVDIYVSPNGRRQCRRCRRVREANREKAA